MTEAQLEKRRAYHRDYYRRHKGRIREGARERERVKSLSEVLCLCGCGEYTHLSKQGKPSKFLPGHNRRLVERKGHVAEDRGFISPCWIWQGSPERDGYGQVRVDGVHKRAHRWYYERFVSAIPKGFEVDHLCYVRLCVNPNHLEAVPPAVNLWRASIRKLGLSPLQLLSLRSWMGDNLTDEQLRKLW
jgi:hypothetical protein